MIVEQVSCGVAVATMTAEQMSCGVAVATRATGEGRIAHRVAEKEHPPWTRYPG
jgi:ribosomal protein L31